MAEVEVALDNCLELFPVALSDEGPLVASKPLKGLAMTLSQHWFRRLPGQGDLVPACSGEKNSVSRVVVLDCLFSSGQRLSWLGRFFNLPELGQGVVWLLTDAGDHVVDGCFTLWRVAVRSVHSSEGPAKDCPPGTGSAWTSPCLSWQHDLVEDVLPQH